MKKNKKWMVVKSIRFNPDHLKKLKKLNKTDEFIDKCRSLLEGLVDGDAVKQNEGADVSSSG